MISRYAADQSLSQIGRDLGCTASGVRMILKRHNIQLREKGKFIQLTKDQTSEICRMFLENSSVIDIARAINITPSRVARFLATVNLREISNPGVAEKLSIDVQEIIRNRYLGGERVRHLAVEYKVSRKLILRILKDGNIPLRGTIRLEKRLTADDIEKITFMRRRLIRFWETL
jgi:hypothetical protein